MDDVIDEAAGWVKIDEDGNGTDADGNSTVVVTLGGEIDISVADSIVADVDAAIPDRDGRRLVFDLSGVEFMDSSGISVLLRLRTGFDDVAVRAPSVAVQRVIEATGLGDQFPVEP